MDGVIFDMDGILVDTEVFYFERRMTFFQEQGLIPATKDIMDFVGETNQGIWKKLIPDDAKLRMKMSKVYEVYRTQHPADFQALINSEVKPLFQQLKQTGQKIAIASSSPRLEIENMISANDLEGYLDYVISGEELTESKPNPEIYLKAKAVLGPGNYLAVEDSEIGIKAAVEAGLFTVALKNPFATNQSQADVRIDNLMEVLDYL
ncbi:TPA: HAD family hydrolase [Streptococcus suis]